ncbi:MAG TPA: PIG-L family deacetylase [Anaerolineales bacterium]|nr:PIG-L family deacetylase [Anaerolineales bacterium]
MHVYGRKLLFLGAHPDDIELGCGALLSNIGQKADVLCVTLSDNRKNPALQNLVDEHYRSMALLGIGRDQIILGPFETRYFPRDRQEILEYLFELNRTHRPEMVFVHTESDIHQDHSVTTVEALRAFRGTTVLGFDVLRSSYGFFPNFLVEVSEADVELKVKCLLEYTTYCDKYYFSPDVVRSTLIRHGALAERPFAEGFDILRIIGQFDAPGRA